MLSAFQPADHCYNIAAQLLSSLFPFTISIPYCTISHLFLLTHYAFIFSLSLKPALTPDNLLLLYYLFFSTLFYYIYFFQSASIHMTRSQVNLKA